MSLMSGAPRGWRLDGHPHWWANLDDHRFYLYVTGPDAAYDFHGETRPVHDDGLWHWTVVDHHHPDGAGYAETGGVATTFDEAATAAEAAMGAAR